MSNHPIAKLCRELSRIQFSTAHAQQRASRVIRQLHTYDSSVQSGGDINFVALDDAISGMVWLMEHIRYINDRQVLPSQRLFLAECHATCVQLHQTQSSI